MCVEIFTMSNSISTDTDLSGRIIVVLPVPVVTRHTTAHQVYIRWKWMETFTAMFIPWVSGSHADSCQTLSHLNVFHADNITSTPPWVMHGCQYKPTESFTTQHIASTTTHVALSNVRLEPTTKVHRITGAVSLYMHTTLNSTYTHCGFNSTTTYPTSLGRRLVVKQTHTHTPL